MGKKTNILPDRELFVGRQRECATLERSLRGGERLISVIAPSGTGKTRLAKQVGLRLELEYSEGGGVWFCDLSAARTEEELVATVALALGLSNAVRSGESDFVRALLQLGGVLIILDNFESLEPEAGLLVQRWLEGAPKLQVLVTSLSALGIGGESLFELGPLAAEDAIALYEDRARRAWAGERVFFSGEQRALGELVQRLDRLPLAIELAAARVRALPPRVMLSRIEDRFELLRVRETGRHSSLEHAIYCSWELLDEEERLVFAGASVFSGGFTLTAAEAVLGVDGPIGAKNVVDILGGLRDKALIQLDQAQASRFSLYESMQAFAAVELERTGKRAETKRRHADYFVELAEGWVDESKGPAGPRALEALIAERENLIAAHRRHLHADPALSARAAIAASVALDLVATPAAVAELIRGAVAAARQAQSPAILVQALRIEAGALGRSGRIEEAIELLDDALQEAEGGGLRLQEGFIWAERARLREYRQDFEGVAEDLRLAQQVAEEERSPELRGLILMRAGVLFNSTGERAQSRQAYEEAREVFERLGDQRSLGRILVNLAHPHLNDGALDEARASLERARECFLAVGEFGEEATARLGLGAVERAVGNYAEAEAHLTAALGQERRFGNRNFEGLALANLGVLAFEQEQPRLAARRLSEALRILREAGDGSALREVLPFVGAVKAILGELEEARTHFDEVRAASERPFGMLEILEGFLDLALAREAYQERQPKEAAAHLDRARGRLAVTSVPPTQIRSVTRLLEKALARFGEGEEAAEVPLVGEEPLAALPVLEASGAWFEPPEGERVALGVKSVRRRLLRALIDQRLLAPGVGLSLEQLLEIGWPEQSAHPSVASNRVYKSINWLRGAGLEKVLFRHADGYLLSQDAVIVRDAL